MSKSKTFDNNSDFFNGFVTAVDSAPPLIQRSVTLRGLALRSKIVETLLRLGVERNEKQVAVAARLIETIITDRDSELDEIMESFAAAHCAQKSAVQYIVDRCFNIYDPQFIKRVTDYTHSEPFTARDVLYDIAMRIRREQYSYEAVEHE